MENLNRGAKPKLYENNNSIKMSMADWKNWSDRYFPIEKQFDNWERELIWVLKRPI